MNKIVSSLASLPPPPLDAAMNSESRNESKSDSSVPPVLSFPSQSSLAALNVAPMLKAKQGRVARPATQPTSNSNTAQLPCPIEGCFTRSGPTALYKHVESHIRGAFSDDSCRPSDKWLQDHKRSVCTNCCGLFSTVRIKSISGSERNEGPNAAQASFSMSSDCGAVGDFISSASPFVIGAS